MSFEKYLEWHGIEVANLPNIVSVDVMRDADAEMAYISIAGEIVHYSHEDDFNEDFVDHPHIGEYDSLDELLEIIDVSLTEMGHTCEVYYGNFIYIALNDDF